MARDHPRDFYRFKNKKEYDNKNDNNNYNKGYKLVKIISSFFY